MAKPVHADLMPMTRQPLTTLGERMPDGRARNADPRDKSVWLIRSAPMFPVPDARNRRERENATAPIYRMFRALSDMVPNSYTTRFRAKSHYREYRILLINMPRRFWLDPRKHDLAVRLNTEFDPKSSGKEYETYRRFALMGVKLKDRIGGGSTSIRDQLSSAAAFFADRSIPMEDYNADFDMVDTAFTNAGFNYATSEQFALSDSWWNRGDGPSVPILNHDDHLHVISQASQLRQVDQLGRDLCEELSMIPGQFALTMGSVNEINVDGIPSMGRDASWITDLIYGMQGAYAVSITGLVEPPKITTEMLRRQRGRIQQDIQKMADVGKVDNMHQQDMLSKIEYLQAVYSAKDANPTLIDTSIVAGFPGIQDFSRFNNSSGSRFSVAPLNNQQGALYETQLCSHIKANPTSAMHELPAQTIAAGGVNSLSTVGDATGAMFGFTEYDRQIAFLDPRRASHEDKVPMLLCVGQTGSGKTMLMTWLADQFADPAMGLNGVMIDPKKKSDLSGSVTRGNVYSFDELAGESGVLDSIRYSTTKSDGVTHAASTLMQIFGKEQWLSGNESTLLYLLNFGAINLGHTATGTALRAAQEDSKVRDEIGHREVDNIVNGIMRNVEYNNYLRMLIGTEDDGPSLNLNQGTTLIMVGDSDIPLPGMNDDPATYDLSQKIAIALIRNMVFGAAYALAGRGTAGFIMLDEAWMFLGAGKDEIDKLGRLARSQGILPCLFTQKVSDALNAGLAGYISRVCVGPIQDEGEAMAACKIADIEPDDYLDRIMAKPTISDESGESTGVPNWGSMAALYDQGDRKGERGPNIRGTIWLYLDADNRVVPVEHVLTQDFLDRTSTNVADQARRHRREEERLQRQAQEAAEQAQFAREVTPV